MEPIKLKHPLELPGRQVTELRWKRQPGDIRMGDIVAIQCYARAKGLKTDVGTLLAEGDIGALLVLIERVFGLPEGSGELLHPDDFAEIISKLAPFLNSESP